MRLHLSKARAYAQAVVASRHHGHGGPRVSVNRTALSATIHGLTGCAIGEVLGMVIGTAMA